MSLTRCCLAFGFDKGLAPTRRQTFIETNADLTINPRKNIPLRCLNPDISIRQKGYSENIVRWVAAITVQPNMTEVDSNT